MSIVFRHPSCMNGAHSKSLRTECSLCTVRCEGGKVVGVVKVRSSAQQTCGWEEENMLYGNQ